MRFSKSLFLAFAGLGLFACSNEDVVENGGAIEGDANVVVRINTDGLSRALATPTTSKAVTGEAVVTLQTLDGPKTEKITLPITEQNKTVEFEGVNGPGKISVNVNSYTEDIALTAMNGKGVNAGLNAPMYAEDMVGEWKFDDKTNTYSGTLAPEHKKVARLELSGIKHVKDGDKDCWFKTITFDGLFLNNIKANTNANAATSFNNWAAVTAQTNTAMPCFDKVDATEGAKFLNDGADATVYPANNQCYAYNITAGDCPTLTLCFSDIELTDARLSAGGWWNEEGLGYATVATYQAKGSEIKTYAKDFGVTDENIVDNQMYKITKFPAGFIYRVEDLKLTDHNIGQTIDGKPVNVTATISIDEWKLVNGSVEWNGTEAN